MLALVIGEGQLGGPLAEQGVEPGGGEVAHEVGAEDVGKAAAAGEEVAVGAEIRQHGGEEGGDSGGEDQCGGGEGQGKCAQPGPRRAGRSRDGGELPDCDQGAEDEEKGGVGQLGPSLERDEEAGEQPVAGGAAGGIAVYGSQGVEGGEGDPMAAGDVELAQRGIEELG